MANVQSIRASGVFSGGRFVATIAAIRTAIERRRLYLRTHRELSALTVRELTDLGINPTMIPQIAHVAAYGK